MLPVRHAVALIVATGLVLGAGVAAAAPSRGDPRGANLVYETPGWTGAPDAPVVALTFDDGPHPAYTPQILDILAAKGVQATFFLLGSEAERHPDIVRRIVADGHIVANHTWDHPHLPDLSEERFAHQIDHTNQVLESISGQEVVCARPPYGDARPDTVGRMAAHGLTSVVWTADSEDFQKRGADAVVANSLEGLRGGSIILLHDGGGTRDETIAALPRLIDEVRGRGFELVPVCDGRPHLPVGHVEVADSPSPEAIRVEGWASDPDAAEPAAVSVTLDGAVVHEGPAGVDRADEQLGFAVRVPAGPGEHSVCVTVRNVGMGHDVALGCFGVAVTEVPWYDRLGRYLGLLEGSERFAAPDAAGRDPLTEMVDTLIPVDGLQAPGPG